MCHDGWPLPESDLYLLKVTPAAGRAIFARTSIQPGTPILSTTAKHGEALSPTSHVILRPYRREVCAQCFAYDRGREWKLRLPDAGVVFCSDQCQQHWRKENGELGLAAYEAVEGSIKDQLKRRGNKEGNHEDPRDDSQIRWPDATTVDQFISAWQEAATIGSQILAARDKEKLSKLDRRVLRTATEGIADPDVLAYVLSGVLSAHKAFVDMILPDATNSVSDILPGSRRISQLLPAMMTLADDPTVYTTNSSLSEYIRAYHLLLAILPMPLLDFLQPALCHELASRASHNAFSIRPAGTTDGEQSGEFLGWGIWPEASFFNHSCRPNVYKERRGRQWMFTVREECDHGGVNEGDELCITYLGGDEKDLDVSTRREKLKNEWGFWCACTRCREESGE